MKLTCLSKGSGVHYPSCHLLELSGFRLLLECPIDLSALGVFAPIAAARQLEPFEFIRAEPWYKTANNLHLWDVSLIDVILISTPDSMLGLPFLTRNPMFTAKIYATEATMRIGRLMMDDIVSMHSEFVQFYGRNDRKASPEWMGWKELQRLPLRAQEIVMGKDGEDFGCWHPLYSAAEIHDCIKKVQPLKYAEEVCYNSTIMLKAFSSGLEIGSCNWKINSPRRNLVYLSSSIFESAQTTDFDYRSLKDADIILFSDMSSLNDMEEDCGLSSVSESDIKKDEDLVTGYASIPRTPLADKDKVAENLMDNCDISEEDDKIKFISSCVIKSVSGGGSVLIPLGRLGILLQLLEQISHLLESYSLEVPIFMISTTAEQALAFTNAIPEWLCKKRQQKLFCGEPLFCHAELIKEKKLHVFPFLYSSDILLKWKEPCIVFTSHWSLRLGPVIHLLDRWHADPRCLLILEVFLLQNIMYFLFDNFAPVKLIVQLDCSLWQLCLLQEVVSNKLSYMKQGIDIDMALLPFKAGMIRVLQCSFLSGIRTHRIYPLLDMLQPKLVLFPEDFRSFCSSQGSSAFSFLFYSVNSKLRVPSLQNDFEGSLSTDLAFQLQPRRLISKEMAIARISGKLELNKGKYLLVPPRKPINLRGMRLLLWGSVDAARLVVALKEKGIYCSIERSEDDSVSKGDAHSVRIKISDEALIETSATKTVICTGNATMAAQINEALLSICDGI